MYKCLTVVALVLLVLTGAMGLKNLTANAATFSSASAVWASGPGPIPTPGGGHVWASGPGPIPTPGGGHFKLSGPGPIPTPGGGH